MKPLLFFALIQVAALRLLAADAPPGPKQPIDFNHKLHATALKQPCASCHADRDPGELVDMPEIGQCWQCHSALPAKTPAEQKLAAYAKQGRDIDWVRVYQIPSYVRFNHRQHEKAGAKCETCHGPVAQREALYRERDLSMGACMDCHRETHASIDCSSCHEPR